MSILLVRKRSVASLFLFHEIELIVMEWSWSSNDLTISPLHTWTRPPTNPIANLVPSNYKSLILSVPVNSKGKWYILLTSQSTHATKLVDNVSTMVAFQSENGMKSQSSSSWNKHNFPFSKPQTKTGLNGFIAQHIILSWSSLGHVLLVLVVFIKPFKNKKTNEETNKLLTYSGRFKNNSLE